MAEGRGRRVAQARSSEARDGVIPEGGVGAGVGAGVRASTASPLASAAAFAARCFSR
jgi:hypothetical protein